MMDNNFYIEENFWLYSAVEAARFGLTPYRSVFKFANYWNDHFNPLRDEMPGHLIAANYEMWERLTKRYQKPKFDINYIIGQDKKEYKITQKTLLKKPFCNLIHFEKENSSGQQPKLLLVAPLSGHYATLLRGTVKDSLPYFDVYVTDWMNAKDVPLYKGKFDLDDYIDYTIDFINYMGDGVNVMAVCQPTVPVLAAVAIMAKEKSSTHVNSMILMGGPIDARLSPTKVNEFANTRSLHWFENHVITRVPINYAGRGRAVYPGFIQLAGFLSMNMQRHMGELWKLYQHLIVGDEDEADLQRKFYDEYLSVMDMPAEFYLQTVKAVFQDFSLPLGKMVSRDRKVDPGLIKDTAVLIIEGERDDISGVGQTKAALDLCKNVPKKLTHYHLQAGAGHYGVFNGSKFRNHIIPLISEFAGKAEAHFAGKKH